jgi:MinD superfamily P-loop ATPase
MIVGVASGKGGTGKTTVAVNLAWCAPEPAQLLDCDVEEPNCHLFFDLEADRTEPVVMPVPKLDPTRCTGCGLCRRICQFHAVALLGKRPLFFQDLCRGCGGCALVCPRGAITESDIEIGTVSVSDAGRCTLVEGRLKVGRALSPPVIREVRRRADAGRLTVIDGPPGTACSMVAALTGCDYALLVAEPTRFGLHDLGLAVESVRQLGSPFGVVANRVHGGSEALRAWCRDEGIELLAELPEDREVASAQGRGRLASEVVPGMRGAFEQLWASILARASARRPEGGAHRACV